MFSIWGFAGFFYSRQLQLLGIFDKVDSHPQGLSLFLSLLQLASRFCLCSGATKTELHDKHGKLCCRHLRYWYQAPAFTAIPQDSKCSCMQSSHGNAMALQAFSRPWISIHCSRHFPKPGRLCSISKSEKGGTHNRNQKTKLDRPLLRIHTAMDSKRPNKTAHKKYEIIWNKLTGSTCVTVLCVASYKTIDCIWLHHIIASHWCFPTLIGCERLWLPFCLVRPLFEVFPGKSTSGSAPVTPRVPQLRQLPGSTSCPFDPFWTIGQRFSILQSDSVNSFDCLESWSCKAATQSADVSCLDLGIKDFRWMQQLCSSSYR